jgi:Fe2+ transport system protein FeoA
MKVKGKVEKLSNFNAMNVPCSSLELSKLKDGKEINLEQEVAQKMLAMGLVSKVNIKKSKKGEK